MEHIKHLAQNWDLTKPFTAETLESLSNHELELLKTLLHRRMVEIVGETLELTAVDRHDRLMAKGRQFRSAIPNGGEIVFYHTTQRSLQKDLVFKPGPWVADHIEMLEALREIKRQNVLTFPQRRRAELVSELTGGRAA